jgi:hypothetical protein
LVVSDERDTDALKQMLEAGASLGGATTGAMVGAALAGPIGIPGGAAAGWAVERLMKVGGEYAMRSLGHREAMRAGNVLLLAQQEISARLMSGEEPREDLRQEVSPGRSPAEELAEVALRTAAHTHEERKLAYLAHLVAALTFEPDVSHAHANQLMGLADDLTYRQLVALAVYEELDAPSALMEFWGEARSYEEETGELASLRGDLLDLFRRGLVRVSLRTRNVRKEKPYRPSTTRRGAVPRLPEREWVRDELPWPAMPREISPHDIRLTPEGELLTRLMRLGDITRGERERLVVEHLRIPPRE